VFSVSSVVQFNVMDGPLLIFDGECRFCRKSVARLRRWAGQDIPARASQEIEPGTAGITCAEAESAVQYIDRAGRRHQAARAVFTCMAEHGISRLPLFAYQVIPGFARVMEWGYRLVARNRATFSRVEFALAGPSLEPATYDTAMGLFLRGLGLVFALAFVSLGVQVSGLYGLGGIWPVSDVLGQAAERGLTWGRLPSVFWLGCGPAALQSAWILGTLAGLLVAAGVAQAPLLFIAWALYLSFCSVGGPFLNFQWDALLLECGILGALAAGWRWWTPSIAQRHPAVARGLLLWLLFRLMFFSGAVKLASGDTAWSGLTALGHHFETQPLPNPLSWHAHHLPDWIHLAATAGMFAVELILPFAIFLPRRARLSAAAAFTALQLGILATGNYGFFNLLTLLLVAVLLDDETLQRLRLPGARAVPDRLCPTRTLPALVWAVPVLLFSALHFQFLFRLDLTPPSFVTSALGVLQPLRSINSYGLFATMTRDRPEIRVQGSDDGVVWKDYTFRWKPGDLHRAPPVLIGSMPRLDWQMWFAALGDVRNNGWFVSFAKRLLEGSPDVLALMESNPFPDRPPTYVRALLEDYRFTTPGERDATGAWWHATARRTYLPPVSLESFQPR
jgi:predicted DCC family thiol-disulfide oxidoreductase YuxK